MWRVSKEFRIRLKFSEVPAWRLAQRNGSSASTLSKLVTGCSPVQPHDARIVAVGRALGLSSKACFEAPPPPVVTVGERVSPFRRADEPSSVEPPEQPLNEAQGAGTT